VLPAFFQVGAMEQGKPSELTAAAESDVPTNFRLEI
jgi:hypothetical protein